MGHQTLHLNNQLHIYMLRNFVKESLVAKKLRQETMKLNMAKMQISPDQAHFMAFLAKLVNAKTYLEIGTFTGYSCLSVVEAMGPGSRAIACDTSEEWTDIAKKYWREAGIKDQIDLRMGPALTTLKTVRPESMDMIFIDADKKNYTKYYERGLELLKVGGLMLIDNVFWNGAVADSSKHDPETIAIRELNALIAQDESVDASMLAIGDGLMLVRKQVSFL